MTKLLLLDKDGTLVSPKSNQRFPQSPWDQIELPGVYSAWDNYKAWTPVIISNQAGISAGYKTLEETFLEMRFCLEMFPDVKSAYFCPDFDGSHCWEVWADCKEAHRILFDAHHTEVIDLGLQGLFRKPNAGMLKLAIALHGATEALMVGDRPEDQQAAQAANIPFMWAQEWRDDGNP